MCELDFDSAEDSESENSVENDANAIELKETQSMSSTEKSEVKAAKASSEKITKISSSMRNTTAVAVNDARFDDDDFPLLKSRKAKEQVRDANEAHRDIARSTGKGKLFTRVKFWAVVAPGIISSFLLVTSVSALVLSIKANERNQPDPTDPSDLPDDLKKYVKKNVKRWKGMEVGKAMSKIAGFAQGSSLSLQAQILTVSDLKDITTPTKPSVLAKDEELRTKLVQELIDAYVASKQKPKAMDAYAKAAKIKILDEVDPKKTRNLTVYEAALLCDLALSEMYVVRKAQHKVHPVTQRYFIYKTPKSSDIAAYHKLLMGRQPLVQLEQSPANDRSNLPIDIKHIDDLPNDLPASVLRDATVRSQKAAEFWGEIVPRLSDEKVFRERVGFLGSKHEALPKGSLVYERESDKGGLALVVPHIEISVDDKGVSTTTKMDFLGAQQAGIAELAFATQITGSNAVKEAAQIGSLVGMVVMSTNPIAGVVMMVGGQVVSWLIGELGKTKPPLPTDTQLLASLKSVIEDNDVIVLSGKVASIWKDLSSQLNRGWTPGNVPSATDLSDFKSVLHRGADISLPDGGHDCVNQIQTHVDALDANNNPVGLKFLPAFVVAANIEILCLQNLAMIAMAESNAGNSSDDNKNKAYKGAIERAVNRIDDLVSYLETTLAKGEQLSKTRVELIGPVLDDNPSGPTYGFGISGWDSACDAYFFLLDAGIFPQPKSFRLNLSAYVVMEHCCYVDDEINRPPAKKAADKARSKYVQAVTNTANTALGVQDLPTQKSTLSDWKKSQKNMRSTFDLLKTLVPG